LPIEDFNYGIRGFNQFAWVPVPSHVGGEGLSPYGGFGGEGDGSFWGWWQGGFQTIRNVNQFIQNIPIANLSQEKKQTYLGEAMFIRAYDYFGLVKRYGGVPIISKVQTFNGNNLAELQVPRDKEQDVYDYIGQQLDSAILLLPETSERGRATKSIAMTLKSRAMLFAGSIARYGSVQLNGLVGIPAGDANKYFQASFDAAATVIQSGKFSLYNAKPDKTDNFTSLFLEKANNPECILVRDYSYPANTHCYDLFNLPTGIMGPSGYGSAIAPTLEMAEEFEYVDGTPGNLKLTDGSGTPIQYSDPTALFANKDPRLQATVVVPFAKLKGSVIDVQAGIIDDETAETSYSTVYGRKMISVGDFGQYYDATSHMISPDGKLIIIGMNGLGGIERGTSGFYIRKYIDTSLPQSLSYEWHSTQSWIEMRYAEVLLNYAEAAIELGDVQDSKTAVNLIRERAGIALLNDADVTIDRIRHERKVELAFENHHYWDIRRWRIADQFIYNTTWSQIRPYYDLQSGNYVFSRGDAPGDPLFFLRKLYYEKIPVEEIQANPKIIQNPLY
jgi:hypothetical protein